jgi:hypothetical protein
MRCNPTARWGPGTTKERAPDTESANQLKARLEQMAKERAKQDSMWQPQSPEAQDQGKVNEPPKK